MQSEHATHTSVQSRYKKLLFSASDFRVDRIKGQRVTLCHITWVTLGAAGDLSTIRGLIGVIRLVI